MMLCYKLLMECGTRGFLSLKKVFVKFRFRSISYTFECSMLSSEMTVHTRKYTWGFPQVFLKSHIGFRSSFNLMGQAKSNIESEPRDLFVEDAETCPGPAPAATRPCPCLPRRGPWESPLSKPPFCGWFPLFPLLLSLCV